MTRKSVQGKFPVINGVQTMPDGREICVTGTAAGKREYTFRTQVMMHRQGNLCAWCKHPFSIHARGTFDHEGGRGMGGGRRDDRIEVNGEWRNAAVHEMCNSLKGSRRFRWVDGEYREAL